jgi:hypothetical protein
VDLTRLVRDFPFDLTTGIDDRYTLSVGTQHSIGLRRLNPCSRCYRVRRTITVDEKYPATKGDNCNQSGQL